jgi:hypothetical protein
MGAAEVILYISVLLGIAIMLPSMVGMQHQAFSDQVAQVEAGQLSTITNAALQYEYGYMASLSTPGSTHTVTVATLVSQGYLAPGTKTTDAMGDPISVQYQADSAGNVTGYVVAQGPYRYPDADAGQILLDLGDRGGYVPEVPVAGQVAGTIYGTGRTWQAAAPAGINPGSIDVKVEANAAQQADDSRFLWRVPAPTAAGNTMSTPLILGAVETPGASCANTGAIAQDGTGAIVSCQSGTWQSVGGGHWRAPVSTFAALPSSGNQNGDVRLTLDTDRAFAWNGSSWAALAVNQNGNLHVPNTLTADNGDAVLENSGDGGELVLRAPNGANAVNMQDASFGAFLTLESNANDSISFVSQRHFMTLWDANQAQQTWAVHSNGTWEGAQGTFCFSGQGNVAHTAWEPCANGDGWQPQYSTGWSMVTQDGPGNLNDQPGWAQGSINVDDSYHRAGGAYPWYSQLSSQVTNLTNDYSSQQGQINNLNNEYGNQQGQITNINNNLNQNINTSNCTAAPYASLQSLCSAVKNSGLGNVGTPEPCPGGGGPACGPVGPSTYSYWGWCGSRFYRYRCIQYDTSAPTVAVPAKSYPQLVFADASAGIGQGGCGSNSNTGKITLSATSGGAPLASQSAQYAKGGSNYNPTDMYFPFSLTFTLPAGQSGQIQLTGGKNGLGCGSIQYAVYQL